MRIVFTRALIVAAILLAAAPASGFESKQGGFSIAFPSQPNIEDVANARGSGQKHRLVKDGHSYSVEYYVSSLSLTMLMDTFEKGLQGVGPIVRKRDFKLGEHPAKDIEVKTKDGVLLVCRTVVTQRHVFDIMVAALTSSPTSQQKAFLASFRVIGE